MKELIKTWAEDGFELKMFDTGTYDKRGQTRIAYEFRDGEELIFEGADFCCSPLHADDSNSSIAALLGFLSLRPGDTDAEYFDAYTERQLEWAGERAEELGMLQMELAGEL